MKIYDYSRAPNPRRVRIYLAEKGISVPYEQVDIIKRENKSEAFRQKNRMGSVPVLELDDGTCISESVSICRYFEALHPDPPLFGSTPLEIARVDMWNRRVELGFYMSVGMVWIHGSPLTARLGGQIEECAVRYRKAALAARQQLDDALADREFLAGDRFSIADISLLITVDFARLVEIVPDDAKEKNLARWYASVSNRPSANA